MLNGQSKKIRQKYDNYLKFILFNTNNFKKLPHSNGIVETICSVAFLVFSFSLPANLIIYT